MIGLLMKQLVLFHFPGKLQIGPTGQVELKLTMDSIWKKPFGLNYLAFGNMILSIGIQPGVPIPIIGIFIHVELIFLSVHSQ